MQALSDYSQAYDAAGERADAEERAVDRWVERLDADEIAAFTVQYLEEQADEFAEWLREQAGDALQNEIDDSKQDEADSQIGYGEY